MHPASSVRLRPGRSLLLFPALSLSAWLSIPSARAAEWRPFGLQGIVVRSLATAPGRVCAGTEGKGVFCLDANSVRTGWRSLGPDGTTITGLWIDPLRTDVIFAAADAPSGIILLFRSLDGGRSWKDVGSNVPPSGLREMFVVRGVAGTSTIYGAGGAVWRSDDLGETWREVYPMAYQSSLEIAPTDPQTIWAGGDLAFAFAPQSLLSLSRDGGQTWNIVFSAGPFNYTPLMDISAHPSLDGVVLTGFFGYILRSTDHFQSFRTVLQSSAYLLVDWGGDGLAFAAARTQSLTGSEAWLSRDGGVTWMPITGTRLAKLSVNDLEADGRQGGLAFAATNDGVYAFFGGGGPLCHDARQGVDAAVLWPGECPPILSPGPVILGDAIVTDRAALRLLTDHIDLGAVHCIVEDADVAFATIDPPDPPPGGLFLILAREEGASDYGTSSDGLPRIPSNGDCR